MCKPAVGSYLNDCSDHWFHPNIIHVYRGFFADVTVTFPIGVTIIMPKLNSKVEKLVDLSNFHAIFSSCQAVTKEKAAFENFKLLGSKYMNEHSVQSL